jgi:acyl-coenzyme A thioesterase 13
MSDEKNRDKDQSAETEEAIAARSRRMVDGLNAMAEAGIPLGEAVPHPEGLADFSRWLGLMVRKAERGRVELAMRTRPEMSNPTGLLHGGVQAAVLDSAIGVTCATLGYRGFPITISLVCNFLGKIPIGEEVIAAGEVMREGTSIIHAHASLLDAHGRIVAEGEANLLKTTYVPAYVSIADGQGEAGKEND